MTTKTTEANIHPDLCCHIASLDHSELMRKIYDCIVFALSLVQTL